MIDVTAKNPFGAEATLKTRSGHYTIYRLPKLAEDRIGDVETLPYSIRVLLEACLRNVDNFVVNESDVIDLANWNARSPKQVEVPFKLGRVVLQDFTGVPAIVDLAALRSAMVRMEGDPKKINPLVPCDLVIDHSVQVDQFATPLSLQFNVEKEFERNIERYQFLRWGQQAFNNFRVVPPATGIVHQVNLEFLAKVVLTRDGIAFPDTLVGTDSHTTMINGLGVVGWGVGGIEAEAVMLGQPLYMLTPEVVGFKVSGELREGVTATDLVLTATQMLRKHGVVGKFVEFYGPGLDAMTLPDRATLANMAPEYGATMGFFPVDRRNAALPDADGPHAGRGRSCRALLQGAGALPHVGIARAAVFEHAVARPLHRGGVDGRAETAAGPRAAEGHENAVAEGPQLGFRQVRPVQSGPREAQRRLGFHYRRSRGDRRHHELHEHQQSLGDGRCRTSRTQRRGEGAQAEAVGENEPGAGSRVVTDYLKQAGLDKPLDALGFNLVGYGCTTCIGNSGPLPDAVSKAVSQGDIVAAAVLSGNRNFEGRINPQVKANYLASPPLVVAYALAGTTDIDLVQEPLGKGRDGKDVFLRDIWPSQKEIVDTINASVSAETYKNEYSKATLGPPEWQKISGASGELYQWDASSTYVQEPPFFVDMPETPGPIEAISGARVLASLGDSVTTDHISPAGSIKADSPAGLFLQQHGVKPLDFNSYGSRRGNDRVMTRGTFANIRLKNLLCPGTEGGVTKYLPTGQQMSIYDAAMKYKEEGTPLVVLAGEEYGTGSSRDWAAKGTYLLGVRAVIAKSFERIHRSNLVGMGVLPLQFREGENREHLGPGRHGNLRHPPRRLAQAAAGDRSHGDQGRRNVRPLHGPLPHRHAH